MKCPYCSGHDTKVVDKRETVDLNTTRRRRECLKCGKRFTTYEKLESTDITVVKKDGRREKYDRNKLRRGLQTATEKLPISVDRIEKLIDDIEGRLRQNKAKEIRSAFIGEQAMKCLKRLHKVAYIRFACVYREFEDVMSFEKEIKELK